MNHHLLVFAFVLLIKITFFKATDAFATTQQHRGGRQGSHCVDGSTRRTPSSCSHEYPTALGLSRTSLQSTYDERNNDYDDWDEANIDLLDDIDDDDIDNDNHDQDDVQYIRYRCRVAYNGATYNGFQYQPTARTIQGELEAAFSRRFNQPDVRIVGAGRTDAGVHARGQAIHFDLKHTRSNDDNNNKDNGYNQTELQQIEYSINRMLHDSLRIWNLCVAPSPSIEYVNGKHSLFRWNVMRKSHGKLYSYRFSTSPCMDPIERHTRWQLDLSSKLRRDHDNSNKNSGSNDNSNAHRSVLDMQYLQKLLRYYEGTHDFGCFAGAVEQQQKKKNAAVANKKKQIITNTKQQRQQQDEQDVDNVKLDDSSSSSSSSKEEILPTPPPIMDTIRTVYSVTLVDEGNDNYRIDVALEGALYKMVRNMVGTAIDACLGRQNLTEEQFKLMLGLSIQNEGDDENDGYGGGETTTKETKKNVSTKFPLIRNNNPCKPAPPQGLTLEWVYYDEEDAKLF